jgi:cell pole-organizing protein PopZ
MNQPAKVQEPSMEEILASIRRIIADDDAAKVPPVAKAPEPPRPAPAPEPPPAANKQDDIDAILNGFDAAPADPPPPPPPRPAAVAPAEPAPPAPEAPEAFASEEPAADILDLTEAMAASAEASAFRPIDAEPDVMFDEPSPEPAFERPPASTRAERDLLSRTTSDAVNSAFNALAQTVLVQNARTLEDLVKEMLRPMLKSWLDDNLPGLVERLVRAEIERVSRGR